MIPALQGTERPRQHRGPGRSVPDTWGPWGPQPWGLRFSEWWIGQHSPGWQEDYRPRPQVPVSCGEGPGLWRAGKPGWAGDRERGQDLVLGVGGAGGAG